jgi:hypothetical protein
MNVKLLFGIFLFVIGLFTAAIGIVGVGKPPAAEVASDAYYNERVVDEGWSHVAVPAIAGLSLAAGAVLMGLGMGRWNHPRTHLESGDEVVDPEGYHKMKHV